MKRNRREEGEERRRREGEEGKERRGRRGGEGEEGKESSFSMDYILIDIHVKSIILSHCSSAYLLLAFMMLAKF